MQYAIIENNTIVNVAEAEPEYAAQQGWIPALDSRIGDLWDGENYSPAAVDLAPLKAAKNAEINAARLAANFSTFTHAGKAIACDQLSRSDIDGTNGFVSLYGTLPPSWPGGWKAVDNSYVSIASVADWKAFYASMFAAGNANFAHAQALKTQLDAAATVEEVAAIAW